MLAERSRPSRTGGTPARIVTFPHWATQSNRWWPALCLLQALGQRQPQIWRYVQLGSDPASSAIDFDQIVRIARIWSWKHWRLARLARALHGREHGVDVMELVDGLDEAEFRLAIEAIAAAGPID
jgi:hypothetical protein